MSEFIRQLTKVIFNIYRMLRTRESNKAHEEERESKITGCIWVVLSFWLIFALVSCGM